MSVAPKELETLCEKNASSYDVKKQRTGEFEADCHLCAGDIFSIAHLVPNALQNVTIEAAEELLAGQFSFKGVTYQFQGEVDWFFHPSGSHAGWRWDLNRHLFLLSLARAFLYTGREKYLSRIGEILEDWLNKNPCHPLQRNWDSPFEVAARLCNWIWLYRLLYNHTVGNERTITQHLIRGIAIHANYLYHLIEVHLPNNHLLLEAKALYSAGWMLKGFPFGMKLRKRASRHLKNQIGRQIQIDGGHSEQSIGYHRIILSELLELLFQCQENADMEMVQLLRGPLLAMTEFLLAMLRPDGTLPCIGDTSATDTYYRFNPFMMAAVLFNKSEYKNAAVLLGEDDLTMFLLGVSGAELYKRLPLEPLHSQSRSFPRSGYYVINDDEGVHVVIDCGPFCDVKAPFHGHDDILSFDMSIGGVPLFVDSGSNGSPTGTPEAIRWRPYFRGSASHNVIILDGKDRSQFDESSGALQSAKPLDCRWYSDERIVYFSGAHDGYARSLKAIHQREIVSVKGRFLCIIDRVLGAGGHQIDLLYHLAPDKRAIVTGPGRIEIRNEYGFLAHLALTVSAKDGNLEVVRGQEELPLQGWVSQQSGCRMASDAIGFSTRQKLPFLAVSLIQGNKPQIFKVERTPTEPLRLDDSEALFTISNGTERYEFFSASEPSVIKAGNMEIRRRFALLKRDSSDGSEILFTR